MEEKSHEKIKFPISNFQFPISNFLPFLIAISLFSCSNPYEKLQPETSDNQLNFRSFDPDISGQIHNGALDYLADHADSIHSVLDFMDQIFDYIYLETGFHLPDSSRIFQATEFHDSIMQYESIADFIDQNSTFFLPIDKDYLLSLESIANDSYGSFQDYIDEIDGFIDLLEAETDTTLNKDLLFGSASIAKRSAEYWYDYNTTTSHIFENIAPDGKSGGIYLHPCLVRDIVSFAYTYGLLYYGYQYTEENSVKIAFGQASYESALCIFNY